ncbi:MAG: beta-glucosidase, partial [Eubacterium sp.]|nr:beta-glucosidase [Eubacterium sp.]
YEVDKKTDTVYGAGVLGSLENGFLEPMEHHADADTYYQYCTAFPVGTALAQMWDTGLMERFGKAIAAEMEEFHVDLWLAPGMNIHRNPLCGRNFEYFSEDPFLSGSMGAAITKGVQENGHCGVTIKHFACNNQEDNRMGVDVCISERALREIYLRGFEIAVKTSAPAAIMTSYNLINGVHAANSRDLCTVAARNEWGFDGVIMSDWNTTVPEDGSVSWKCAAAGNDIIMPGNAKDAQSIRLAYERGELSQEEIRACAGRVIK